MTVFDGQIGISAESTWGTFVVPARHLEFNSENFAQFKDKICKK